MGAMESIASMTCAAKREKEKDRDLKGRVVLITGCSKGMGHYMAKVLAGKGARVIAVARSVTPEWVDPLKDAASAGGGELYALTCDISSLKDINSLFSEKLPKLGLKTIDVLINNAGIMPCFAQDPVSTPHDLEEATIRTNVDGTHFVTKHALKFMLVTEEQKKEDPFQKTIVFMGSAAAWLTDPEFGNGMLAYHASKAAVNGLMVHLYQTFDAPTDNDITKRVRAGRSLGRVVSADPGFVQTSLGMETQPEVDEKTKQGWGAIPIEDGAKTALWLVTAPDRDVQNGKAYYLQKVHSF